jgi:uncharacterized protein (DUF111 family)
VPAPATVELRGFPGTGSATHQRAGHAHRCVTSRRRWPAGAAFRDAIEAIGHGAGTRTLTDRPNLLRLLPVMPRSGGR